MQKSKDAPNAPLKQQYLSEYRKPRPPPSFFTPDLFALAFASTKFYLKQKIKQKPIFDEYLIHYPEIRTDHKMFNSALFMTEQYNNYYLSNRNKCAEKMKMQIEDFNFSKNISKAMRLQQQNPRDRDICQVCNKVYDNYKQHREEQKHQQGIKLSCNPIKMWLLKLIFQNQQPNAPIQDTSIDLKNSNHQIQQMQSSKFSQFELGMKSLKTIMNMMEDLNTKL